jgi:hypothetical protein
MQIVLSVLGAQRLGDRAVSMVAKAVDARPSTVDPAVREDKASS